MVFGPFIARNTRRGFLERIAKLDNVDAIMFDAKIEHLMKKAAAIVAMGGYNTFCEILSLDKPALIVPRKTPRLEQAIRASCAERLGLIHQLDGLDARRRRRARSGGDGRAIKALLQASRSRPRRSSPACWTGSTRIEAITKPWMEAARRGQPLSSRVGVAAE